MQPDVSKFQATQIRNVVILAHVDHGKTTLTDSLLAHQGLISQFQAGQLRYLDSLPEEQRRGITMKSASVALTYSPVLTRLYPCDKLLYLRNVQDPNDLSLGDLSLSTYSDSNFPIITKHVNHQNNVSKPIDSKKDLKSSSCMSSSKHNTEDILVHLIDTPGHVDFYGQVYCSARLADGAIILVDAAEGICAQTRAAFHLAWELQLTPILFLNKIDRLILELHLSSLEIFNRLMQLVESVNAECSIFRQSHKQPIHDDGMEEMSSFYFEPRKGNVIFGSALDGWAFRLNLFANLFSKKIPSLSKKRLNQTLWPGSFFLTKKREIQAVEKGETPLFVSLVMENISSIYRAILIDHDMEQIQKICQFFSLPLTSISIKNKKMLLRTILKGWIPLAPSVFDAIVDSIPSAYSRKEKMSRFVNGEKSELTLAFLAKPIIYPELTEELLKESVSGWTQHAKTALEDDSSSTTQPFCPLESLVMMGRLYSGMLSTSSINGLYFSSKNVLGFDGAKFGYHTFRLENNRFRLYQLMGSKLIEVDQVPEGNIFGISGFLTATRSIFMKNGMLSSLPPNGEISIPTSVHFADDESLKHDSDAYGVSSEMMGVPLISVSVEPEASLRDLTRLQFALMLLYQIDPSANVSFTPMGELILEACGMLHLEQLLKELKSMIDFPISVSDPIVPLGETIDEGHDSYITQDDLPLRSSLNSSFFRDLSDISIKVNPLPDSIHHMHPLNEPPRLINTANDDLKLSSSKSKKTIHPCLSLTMKTNIVDPLLKLTMNLLVFKCDSFTSTFIIDQSCIKYEEIIQKAFLIATSNGPLCGERVHGVGFSVLSLSLDGPNTPELDTTLLFSPIRKMFHLAILSARPKLMQGYNELSIQVSGEWLGRVYALINKAAGDIITGSEFIPERNSFKILTHIPVRSSAEFIDELRSKTAGAAFVNISYFGLKSLDGSPFFTPTLAEGDDMTIDPSSMQRKLVQEVRVRKGLFVATKLTHDGEKQRTLRRC